MHILAGIIGVIGALFFWWYRIKAAGEIAGEVVDRAGRARGWFRRRKLRQKAAESPIVAIDSPIFAAATIMYAHYFNGENGLICDRVISRQLTEITHKAEAEEAVVYAKWAIQQVPDKKFTIDHLGVFLNGKLKAEEKSLFLSLIEEGVQKTGMENDAAAMKSRLMEILGV